MIELAMLSSARSLSADPTPETTSEGTSEPASEATSEPSSEPASEKTSEPASEETSEPASETAKIPVTDVTLSATSLYMTNDGTATVSYTITPQNAKTSTITWTSSNKEIVTVEGGEITSHSKGKATVTCIVVGQDGGSFTKTCEVSVGPYIEKLTVGNKITTIAKGKTQQLSATVTTVGDLDKTVEWTDFPEAEQYRQLIALAKAASK